MDENYSVLRKYLLHIFPELPLYALAYFMAPLLSVWVWVMCKYVTTGGDACVCISVSTVGEVGEGGGVHISAQKRWFPPTLTTHQPANMSVHCCVCTEFQY